MTNLSHIGFLVDQLERSHAGDPWHGTSRMSLLADVTAEEAYQRPGPGAHSIWELVLHMTAWTREVTRRLQGHDASEPDMGDWPTPPATPDDRGWWAAKDALSQAHARLCDTVRAFDPSRLTTRVGDERNAPLGTGVTFEQTITGLLQHDAYHSGQAAILKKLVRGA
jgi:uncharacterized damage-inducible protein DinB